MADINKLKPFILKWEGGFVNDKKDLGGATNKGVTLKTYKDYCEKKGKAVPTVEDLKNLSDEEWTDILRTYFWDSWRADEYVLSQYNGEFRGQISIGANRQYLNDYLKNVLRRAV